MTVVLAIAGQPAREAAMPADAPAAALAAISGMEERLSRRRLFGFLDPLVGASYDPRTETLHTKCHRDLTRRGAHAATIAWRWRQLWQDDSWYEVGWHPNVMFHALLQPFQAALWETINPGKRPWQGLVK